MDSGLRAEIYVPSQQYPWLLSPQHLIVRTAAGVEPASVTGAVVHALQRVDKDQPASDIRTLEQVAGQPIAQQRMVMALLGAFACLALALSALGIYGVVSYSVARRTREIGVRVALGAHPASVLLLVIGDGGRLLAIGIAIGVAAALALTRLLADLLYGVRPTDSPTFIVGVLVLTAASLLACYIPARRAMRVDPIEVLRQE
jgi:ABC-type antimicrobial peptide transport system permease subunit